MTKREFNSERNKLLGRFNDLLKNTRQLLVDITKGEKIELQANGVTFVMIDPFSDETELSDVISIEDGVIELENGTTANVTDVTNLTDLIGLLDVIEY